jgi:hypothetical protein
VLNRRNNGFSPGLAIIKIVFAYWLGTFLAPVFFGILFLIIFGVNYILYLLGFISHSLSYWAGRNDPGRGTPYFIRRALSSSEISKRIPLSPG